MKTVIKIYCGIMIYTVLHSIPVYAQGTETQLMYLEKGFEQIIKNAKESNALLKDIKQELVAIKEALTEEDIIGSEDYLDSDSPLIKNEESVEVSNED